MSVGRSTQAFVSGYFRDRVHNATVYANEIRPLIANFGGALNKGEEIVSATWETYQGLFTSLSNPTLTETTATVTCAFQYSGASVIRCSVVLDTGEKLVQQFRVNVREAPIYPGEYYVTGPSKVVVYRDGTYVVTINGEDIQYNGENVTFGSPT